MVPMTERPDDRRRRPSSAASRLAALLADATDEHPPFASEARADASSATEEAGASPPSGSGAAATTVADPDLRDDEFVAWVRQRPEAPGADAVPLGSDADASSGRTPDPGVADGGANGSDGTPVDDGPEAIDRLDPPATAVESPEDESQAGSVEALSQPAEVGDGAAAVAAGEHVDPGPAEPGVDADLAEPGVEAGPAEPGADDGSAADGHAASEGPEDGSSVEGASDGPEDGSVADGHAAAEGAEDGSSAEDAVVRPRAEVGDDAAAGAADHADAGAAEDLASLPSAVGSASETEGSAPGRDRPVPAEASGRDRPVLPEGTGAEVSSAAPGSEPLTDGPAVTGADESLTEARAADAAAADGPPATLDDPDQTADGAVESSPPASMPGRKDGSRPTAVTAGATAAVAATSAAAASAPAAPSGSAAAPAAPSGSAAASAPTARRSPAGGPSPPDAVRARSAPSSRSAGSDDGTDGRSPGPAPSPAETRSADPPLSRLTIRAVAFGTVFALLLVAVPVLGWVGKERLLDSRGGDVVNGSLTSDEPGYLALVDPTPTALVIQRADPDGPTVAATLLALGMGPTGGTVLQIPLDTEVRDPEFLIDRLIQTEEFGETDLLVQSIADRLNIAIPTVVELDDERLSELVAPVAPLEIDNPDPVVTDSGTEFEADTISLSAEQLGPFLRASSGESDLARLARNSLVWRAWLEAIGRSDTSGSVGPATTGIGPFLRTLAAGDPVVETLDVDEQQDVTIDDPGYTTPLVPEPGFEEQVVQAVPYPLSPGPGRRYDLKLLNGAAGGAEIPRELMHDLILRGAALTQLGNASSFGQDDTRVEFRGEEWEPLAEVAAATLGGGEVAPMSAAQADAEGHDIVITLGQDILDRYAAEADGGG